MLAALQTQTIRSTDRPLSLVLMRGLNSTRTRFGRTGSLFFDGHFEVYKTPCFQTLWLTTALPGFHNGGIHQRPGKFRVRNLTLASISHYQYLSQLLDTRQCHHLRCFQFHWHSYPCKDCHRQHLPSLLPSTFSHTGPSSRGYHLVVRALL